MGIAPALSVTSAGQANSYVWSSRPLADDGAVTLWLVAGDAAKLRVAGKFDGLGMRGNAFSPVSGAGVVVPASARLGDDGAGLDIALSTVLPHFLVLGAAPLHDFIGRRCLGLPMFAAAGT